MLFILDVASDPGCLVPCYSILYFARMHFVETPGLGVFFSSFVQGNADFKICLKLSYSLITFKLMLKVPNLNNNTNYIWETSSTSDIDT